MWLGVSSPYGGGSFERSSCGCGARSPWKPNCPVESVNRLCFDRITVDGVSRAAHETWFCIHPPGLAFDVGRGDPALSAASDIFLSHAHLDHALGLPFVLSMRTQQGKPSTRVLCPREIVDPLARLIRVSEELENVSYDYEIAGLVPGDSVTVGKDLEVEAFPIDHRVPSLGFHLWQTISKLRPEYSQLAKDDLLELKRKGNRLDTEEKHLWLTYCGDTGPGVFDFDTRIFDSSHLILECTFVSAAHHDLAREYRHMHLQDIAVRRDRFRNDELILHHWSTRYDCSTIRDEVRRSLRGMYPKIHLLGCGWESGEGPA